jgi:phosphatidate phosphatase APP1
LYNGFLAAGLVWGLWLGDGGSAVKVFFLCCIVIAGVYGAYSVNRRILFVQAAPAALALGALLVSCYSGRAAAENPKRGQQIVFAPSVASVSGPNQWSILIQGRIFEPAEDSPARRAVIDLLAPAVEASDKDPLYRARAGSLVSDSIPDARISVALGDQVVTLPPSNPAGYFVDDVPLTNDQVKPLARDGLISFESLPAPARPERFRGTAVLVPEEGVIVVTDMDDTIKDTNVNNHKEARANTLVRPFRPVAGMPELYRAWKEAGGPRLHFHVVSAGPWQLHEPLRRFTEEAGFPSFTWDMRSVDATDPETLIKETVKADPERLIEFKVQAIHALMTRFPKRHVVLVGDSGEKDPETYATILSDFTDRVDAVYIHNVTGQDQTAGRYKELFPTPAMAAKLLVFTQPSELPQRLGAGL